MDMETLRQPAEVPPSQAPAANGASFPLALQPFDANRSVPSVRLLTVGDTSSEKPSSERLGSPSLVAGVKRKVDEIVDLSAK
jgi:hypothetical protein